MLHSDIEMSKEEASTGELIDYSGRIYVMVAQTCNASMVARRVFRNMTLPSGKQGAETKQAELSSSVIRSAQKAEDVRHMKSWCVHVGLRYDIHQDWLAARERYVLDIAVPDCISLSSQIRPPGWKVSP